MKNQPIHVSVNPQLECAETLPSRFYTDPSVLALEKERIFRRTWQLVGTLAHPCGEVNGTKRTIAEPESYFTVDLAGEPIVVVRDTAGTLRAFSNVCRHRAGPIAQAAGCRKVFNCAYHGWTYTLDGRLIGTPEVDGMEFFDRSTMGMVPLQCETWEQFIFVNFADNGPSLNEYLGNISELARDSFQNLQLVERRDYLLNCNWKVYVDNYLEGYHIPVVHPGLMKEIDYPRYRCETFRYHSQQFGPVREVKPADAHERVYAPNAHGLKEALYFWLFPNLMLNFYPDNVSTNLIVPLSHDKTLTIFEWYFHDANSVHTRERAAKAIAFSDQVQQEDIHICEAVQRGLQSFTYDRGRYSVNRENGVHHFHMLLTEFLR